MAAVAAVRAEAQLPAAEFLGLGERTSGSAGVCGVDIHGNAGDRSRNNRAVDGSRNVGRDLDEGRGVTRERATELGKQVVVAGGARDEFLEGAETRPVEDAFLDRCFETFEESVALGLLGVVDERLVAAEGNGIIGNGRSLAEGRECLAGDEALIEVAKVAKKSSLEGRPGSHPFGLGDVGVEVRFDPAKGVPLEEGDGVEDAHGLVRVGRGVALEDDVAVKGKLLVLGTSA